MSNLATNPAALPDLSLCMARWENKSRATCNGGVRLRSSAGLHRHGKVAAMATNLFRQNADENFAPACVCRYVSRLLLGHCFGGYPAPCGTRSSASRSVPLWGPGSSQNKFANSGKKHRANFFRAPPRKRTFDTWEPGPLAWLRPV